MSKIVKVSEGNYRLRVQDGGDITLDATPSGTITVIGNLNVTGSTTTVSSTNTNLADNILLLNQGQVGNGISSTVGYTSGIEVARGNYSNAQWLFNETLSHWDSTPLSLTATATASTGNLITLSSVLTLAPGATVVFSGAVFGNLQSSQTYFILSVSGNQVTVSTQYGGSVFVVSNATGSMTATITGRPSLGAWQGRTKDLVLTGVVAASVGTTAGSDLAFDMQNAGSHVVVVNAPTYETTITNPQTLVTKLFVQNYVGASALNPGQADVTTIYYSPNNAVTINSRATATSSSIQFFINEVARAQITNSGLTVGNVNIYQHTIQDTSASQNLVLTAVNTNVEINGVLNLDDTSTSPTLASGTTKIYSKSGLGPTAGKTGLYFKNQVSSDELVSKNRSLLFSILF